MFFLSPDVDEYRQMSNNVWYDFESNTANPHGTRTNRGPWGRLLLHYNSLVRSGNNEGRWIQNRRGQNPTYTRHSMVYR